MNNKGVIFGTGRGIGKKKINKRRDRKLGKIPTELGRGSFVTQKFLDGGGQTSPLPNP